MMLVLMAVLPSAAGAQELPGTRQDRDFDAYVKLLDLEVPSLEFHYKGGRKGGSSVGFHVALPGHRKSGSFVPTNTSSNPEAEVVSYRLARFLGVSGIYNPVTYYQLGPMASGRFNALLRKHGESDPDRRINYNTTTNELKNNPKSLFGIYRFRAQGESLHSSFVRFGRAVR